MLPPTRHREPQWPSKGDGSRNTFLSAPPTPRATSGLFWKVLLALGSTALLLCSPYVLGYGNTHRYVIDGAVSIIDSMGSQPLWPKECARPPYGSLRDFHHRPSNLDSSAIDLFPGKPRITYGQDGKFKIVVFSDLHYGEAEDHTWGLEQDINSTRVMREMIKAENPNFVVINGDLITGESTFKENSTAYLDIMLAPLIEAQIPFAATFGNHDNQANISHIEELNRIKSLTPLAYIETCASCGGAGGEANYFVPVYSCDQAATPSLVLWLFDSRGGVSPGPNSVALPDWVDENVADWITSVSTSLESAWGNLEQSASQSLVFSHIPPNLMEGLQKTLNSTVEPGMNADHMGAGSSQSSLGTSGKDLKWWDAVNQHIPNIIATVHGHDHGNEWCARDPKSQTVLCFNKHTGYGGYSSEGWGYGVRTFDLTLGHLGARTYIRMENGTTHANVILDKTYDITPQS